MKNTFGTTQVVQATPDHWSVYKTESGSYLRVAVAAWAICADDEVTMCMAIHPGVTRHDALPVAVIDPLGVVTKLDGSRRWESWTAFKAWTQAGGSL